MSSTYVLILDIINMDKKIYILLWYVHLSILH